MTTSDINNAHMVACMKIHFTCRMNTKDTRIQVEKGLQNTSPGRFSFVYTYQGWIQRFLKGGALYVGHRLASEENFRFQMV